MSEAIKINKTNEVYRAFLHDSAPELAVSKTLSCDTLPGARMTYREGDAVMKIEHRGRTHFMPVTNIKLISMK